MAEAHFSDRGDGRWSLTGELNFTSVPGLLDELQGIARTGQTVELDLQAVTRVDSAGLALLIEFLRSAGRAGNSVQFVNVPEQLLSIAQVSGLDAILSLSSAATA
jgi:phospholipid transport system transporter-binding protein